MLSTSFHLGEEDHRIESDGTSTNHTELDLDIDETTRLPPSSLLLKKVQTAFLPPLVNASEINIKNTFSPIVQCLVDYEGDSDEDDDDEDEEDSESPHLSKKARME